MNKIAIYSSLIFFSLLCSLPLVAAPSFRVVKVIGTTSLIDEKNDAKNLSQGVFLPTNSKIMVSKGSQLTFNSETGAVFHLSEGSALEIWRDQLVLISGTLWVQSSKEDKEQNIETMNSFVEFKKAEFVLSFDDIVKKSQVFVISGHASISNIFMKDKKELLVSGEISFVQKDFQQGMPRRAALIGNESLANVFSKFKGVKPGDENFQTILNQEHPNKEREDFSPTGGRSIASTPGEVGGIYFLPKSFSAPKRFHPLKTRNKNRNPASVETTKVIVSNSKNLKPIRVFDLSNQFVKKSVTTILEEETVKVLPPQPMAKEKRVPASAKTKVEHKKPLGENEPDFDALMKELKGVSPDHNEVY
jgi:hypothetical protein